MKTTAKKTNHTRLVLLLLFIFSAAAGILAALSSPRVKHALLLRFGTPQAYMAYVETNYLLTRAAEWKTAFQAVSEPFSRTELTGSQLKLQVNHLISDLLAEHDISAELDFSDAALLFLISEKETDMLFQAALQVNDAPIASLDFLRSGADETLYIACPQAGSAALAFSTAQDDPFIMLFEYLGTLFRAFQASVSHAVSSDPYSYLLPYLDAIHTVELERGAKLPVPDSERSALRLDMRLSLDAALDLAAAQLAEIKNQPEITDFLLPCYEACIRLFRALAKRHPADLLIRAYVDEDGNILGHEFFLLFGEETLFSLTGLLQPDLSGGKSGELSLYSALGEKPLTIALSISRLGFDAAEGGVTGKVNVTLDRISSINFQFLFSMEKSSGKSDPISLPKLTLHARTLGITLFTLAVTPTDAKPQYFPSPNDYTEIYRLAGLSAFVQSLDFSEIAEDFYRKTGIRLSSLAALFHSWYNRNPDAAD